MRWHSQRRYWQQQARVPTGTDSGAVTDFQGGVDRLDVSALSADTIPAACQEVIFTLFDLNASSGALVDVLGVGFDHLDDTDFV
ncbi:MAG: hypothetical protein ACR2RE_11950 [Geminicoccaceae bacterium]